MTQIQPGTTRYTTATDASPDPATEPPCLEKLWETISYAFCPQQSLQRITAGYFNPAPQVTPRHWSELYDRYQFFGNVPDPVAATTPDLDPQREVILFQPIAIRETNGAITRFAPEQIQELVNAILQAHQSKGVPLEHFDILVRKEPLVVDRSQVNDTGENTAAALQGGVPLDQNDKLALFGYRSEKIGYTFQLIPSAGRSQATGFNRERMQAVLTHPQELVKFVNPVKLATNLSRLSTQDWSDPQRIGTAFLNALWDGKQTGWRSALGSMGRMEGYCSQLFMKNYNEEMMVEGQ
jgi:hypothetical protein